MKTELAVEDPNPTMCGGSGEISESTGGEGTAVSLCPGCEQCSDPDLDLGDLA